MSLPAALGKGGVGKSKIAVNLSVALGNTKGYKVGLIDADLYGPSIPTMMGLNGQRPKVELLYGKHKIIPLFAHGVHVISIGFIVEPEQAVVLRGPRLGGLLRQFIQDCLWPELDYLIIDLPPGTGDIQLTLVQTVPVSGAIMVTTPQEVAVIDAVKAMNMFLLPNVNVPIFGRCGKYELVHTSRIAGKQILYFWKGWRSKTGRNVRCVPCWLRFLIVQSVRESGDQGKPAAAQKEHVLAQVFQKLARSTVDRLRLRNQLYEPTRIVKVEH